MRSALRTGVTCVDPCRSALVALSGSEGHLFLGSWCTPSWMGHGRVPAAVAFCRVGEMGAGELALPLSRRGMEWRTGVWSARLWSKCFELVPAKRRHSPTSRRKAVQFEDLRYRGNTQLPRAGGLDDNALCPRGFFFARLDVTRTLSNSPCISVPNFQPPKIERSGARYMSCSPINISSKPSGFVVHATCNTPRGSSPTGKAHAAESPTPGRRSLFRATKRNARGK